MAPARKISALRCRDSFSEAACAVLSVRLDEVEQRHAMITGPEDPQPLHDLRIAAKRLRYSLETFAIAFPEEEAEGYADRIRVLQDVLGRIHDLDVLEELLIGRLAAMDTDARSRGLAIARDTTDAAARTKGLQQLVWGDQRHARFGLYNVIAAKADERREQYAQFVVLWTEWAQTGLLQSIRDMINGTPEQPDDEPTAGEAAVP